MESHEILSQAAELFQDAALERLAIADETRDFAQGDRLRAEAQNLMDAAVVASELAVEVESEFLVAA